MNTSPSLFKALVVALAPGCLLVNLPSAPAQTSNINQTAIEVQARGPVHEAFAQPADTPPVPGPVVPRQPPDPIPEEPPEFQPEGNNMQWFGGYWAWDADRNDFIWISGVYRDAPPGRKYVPGYWEQTGDGWRWVSGFWGPDQQELPYVPTPPQSLENGPSVPPPGPDYSYIPGCWLYKDLRFVWRPGYYAPCRPGFVWMPSRYCWTPGGCIFVGGYWDYPLECRGLLFAPVCFNQPLWRTPGWCWQPHHVVGCGPLLNAFFVDTRFGHYRFGDYYGTTYAQRGIVAWHTYGARQYDPLYSYYRWQNKNNSGWATGLAKLYDGRVNNTLPRPPQTLQQQTALVQKGSVNVQGSNNLTIIQPITQISSSSSMKLAKVSAPQVTQQKTLVQQQKDLSVVRKQTESAFVAKGSVPKVGQAGPAPTLKLAAATPGTVTKTGPVTTNTVQPGNGNVHPGGPVHLDKKVTQLPPPVAVKTPTTTVNPGSVSPAGPVHLYKKTVTQDLKLPANTIKTPATTIHPATINPSVPVHLDKKTTQLSPPTPVRTTSFTPSTVAKTNIAPAKVTSLPKTGNTVTARQVHVNPAPASRPSVSSSHAPAHASSSKGHRK
jgi:hypothetical protein